MQKWWLWWNGRARSVKFWILKDSSAQDGNNGWQILVRVTHEVLLPLTGREQEWEERICSRNITFGMSYQTAQGGVEGVSGVWGAEDTSVSTLDLEGTLDMNSV